MANATASPTGHEEAEARGAIPCSLQGDAGHVVVYREYAPPADLQAYAVCTWTLEIPAGDRPHSQHVLPDGCSDIVWMGEARPIVVGPMTRPALTSAAEATVITGVRFRPEAGAAVLGVPAHELADRRIALDDLWNRHVVSTASERLWEERTAAGRIEAVHALLASRRERIATPDLTVQQAIWQLTADRSGGIRELARQMRISERQLQRRFLTATGYSPKMFQRIVRFQKLLALAKSRPAARLGDAAHAAGYADQAHMTREVGEFSGVTPSALLGKVDSALALYEMLHARD
jgi:AraC-like DNA-binding protein